MQYQCETCHYIYDEATEGKRFDELPDDWECPICSSMKEMFLII